MATKRAPGAGRKPRGEFQGKSAVLTTRITPETRAALERAAAKGKNRSLSQVAEKALSVYLSMLEASPERGDHINALGEAVKLVAQYIERATGQRWNDDAFSGEAVRQGCGTLIAHFAPRGMPVTPRLIKEAAKLSQLSARTVSEFRDRVRSASTLRLIRSSHLSLMARWVHPRLQRACAQFRYRGNWSRCSKVTKSNQSSQSLKT